MINQYQFFGNIQFKKLFNNLFSWKIQFKNWFKIFNLDWFNSIKYPFKTRVSPTTSAIADRRILSDPVVCEFLVVESYHQGSRIEMVYYPTTSSGNANSNYVLAFYSNGKKYIHENLTWPSNPYLQRERKTNQCLVYIWWLVFRQSINHRLIFPWNNFLYVWVSQIYYLLFEGEWINLLHRSRPGRQAFNLNFQSQSHLTTSKLKRPKIAN